MHQLFDRNEAQLEMAVNLAVHPFKVVAERNLDIGLTSGDELNAAHDHLTHDKAELDFLGELVPDIEEDAVSQEFVRIAVELHLCLDGIHMLLRSDRLDQRPVAQREPLAEGLVAFRPELSEAIALEHATQGIDLPHRLLVEANDEGAGIGPVDQEALVDQLPDRLADRAAADAKAVGQLRFDELRARLDLSREDEVPQRLGDLRAACHGQHDIELRQLAPRPRSHLLHLVHQTAFPTPRDTSL